jgi:hypothetical protein
LLIDRTPTAHIHERNAHPMSAVTVNEDDRLSRAQ